VYSDGEAQSRTGSFDSRASRAGSYDSRASRGGSVHSRSSMGGGAQSTSDQRHADLGTLPGANSHNTGANSNNSVQPSHTPPPPAAHFVRNSRSRSCDSLAPSRANSAASAGAVDLVLDVSGVGDGVRVRDDWRSPVTPRPGSFAQQQQQQLHQHTSAYLPPPPSTGGGVSRSGGEGVPSPPQAVPDGFAIQLDMLPDPKRGYVLKEEVRAGSLSLLYLSLLIPLCVCVCALIRLYQCYIRV
jgi:hypothetical protein